MDERLFHSARCLPDPYNGQPLMFASEARFRKDCFATGKKLDMRKFCVRIKRLDDLSLEEIGDAIAAMPLDEFVAGAESARRR